jgi:hypothetical protein
VLLPFARDSAPLERVSIDLVTKFRCEVKNQNGVVFLSSGLGFFCSIACLVVKL